MTATRQSYFTRAPFIVSSCGSNRGQVGMIVGFVKGISDFEIAVRAAATKMGSSDIR